MRAAWAISNVCSCLPTTGVESTQVDELEYDAVVSILRAMLNAIDGDEKVVYSVVRTIGRVVQYLVTIMENSEIINDCRTLIDEGMSALGNVVSTGSTSKICWNACHAIALVLQTPTFPVSSSIWIPVVVSNLCDAIVAAPNFKVRINAAVALRAIRSRMMLSTCFGKVVRAVVQAFSTTTDLSDISEFQYREQLQLLVSDRHAPYDFDSTLYVRLALLKSYPFTWYCDTRRLSDRLRVRIAAVQHVSIRPCASSRGKR